MIVIDDDDNQRHHLISLESKPIIQSSKSKQECFQLDKWHGGKNRQFSTFCFSDGGCWYFNIVIVIFIFKLMFQCNYCYFLYCYDSVMLDVGVLITNFAPKPVAGERE